MYQQIIKKIIELGDTLPALAGNIVDIGESGRWLTHKDIEIETELTKLIETFKGEHSVYGEEMHDNFIPSENVWIIDPISNAMNFVKGLPHYSVVVSHLHKGELAFTAVYDPSQKELFTAEKGKGTFLNKKQVHVSTRTADTVFMIGPYVIPPYAEKFLKVVEIMSENDSTMRDIGSLAIHYAYVACGRADIAISFNKDTFPEFAGSFLVEEAGGKFTDFNGGVLNTKTAGVIATNGLMHDKVKKLITGIV